MIICFMVILLLILCMSMFTVTSSLNAINRIVLFTPKTIFESSIELVQDNDAFIPFYNKETLKKQLTSYYNNNLLKYCSDYEMKIYYFNDDDSYCVEEKCPNVEVTVISRLVFNYEYSKTIQYQIKEGAYGH